MSLTFTWELYTIVGNLASGPVMYVHRPSFSPLLSQSVCLCISIPPSLSPSIHLTLCMLYDVYIYPPFSSSTSRALFSLPPFCTYVCTYVRMHVYVYICPLTIDPSHSLTCAHFLPVEFIPFLCLPLTLFLTASFFHSDWSIRSTTVIHQICSSIEQNCK